MSSKSSFERPRHLRVHWDDEPEHELHGADIRMKRLSVQDMKDMAKLDLGEDGEELEGEAFDALVDRLADGLVSWNLAERDEETGKMVPRPATREELIEDAELVMAIFAKWTATAGSVPAPLGVRSNGGLPSPEGSDLTDLRSESL